MRRYTINYKFNDCYLPMINCHDMSDVANHLINSREDNSFKVFDHVKQEWVKPEVVFLSCIFSKEKIDIS